MMNRAELQVCVIASERVRQSERAAFNAANSEQAELKMHTVTIWATELCCHPKTTTNCQCSLFE